MMVKRRVCINQHGLKEKRNKEKPRARRPRARVSWTALHQGYIATQQIHYRNMGSYLSRRVAGALVTIYVTIYKNTGLYTDDGKKNPGAFVWESTRRCDQSLSRHRTENIRR
jgi:hypothetical protein